MRSAFRKSLQGKGLDTCRTSFVHCLQLSNPADRKGLLGSTTHTPTPPCGLVWPPSQESGSTTKYSLTRLHNTPGARSIGAYPFSWTLNLQLCCWMSLSICATSEKKLFRSPTLYYNQGSHVVWKVRGSRLKLLVVTSSLTSCMMRKKGLKLPDLFSENLPFDVSFPRGWYGP